MVTKVVVTGMGVVSPVGNCVDEYWRNLCAGKSGIRKVDRFDVSDQASQIAGMAADVEPEGMGAKDMRRMSRNNAFAIAAADEALLHAGVRVDDEDPFRCGVFIGSGIGGLQEVNEDSVKMAEGGPRRVSPLMVPKGLTNMASGIVAIRTGFQGPNRAIVTACATGTQSIGDAADLIRLGKADVMLAGGTESTIIPFALAGFGAMKALSTRNDDPEHASRPFDLDRNGFVMGEGCGMLVLESEEHARARGAEILCEVAGLGETCDAHHITAPRPDGSGCSGAMLAALRQAGVNVEDVDYYNAHGTSTKLNDAGESRALHVVFGETTPPVSSTKSMTGHLLGAAGAIEAIACIQSIRTGVIHPNANYETPDPECDITIVAGDAREADVKIALSCSLGFGGHNGCLALRRYG